MNPSPKETKGIMGNVGTTPPQDSELVAAVRGGSAAAFERLVERYHGMVYVVAYSRVGHRETAEDLAQEAFLRAYLFVGDLTQAECFAGWITRITRNLADKWLRKGQRRSQLATMVPMEGAALENVPDRLATGGREQMEAEEDAKALHEAVFELPLDQREVTLLHYAEGLSKAEIASRLGVHPATVGRQIERAVRSLRGTLEPALRGAMPALRAAPAGRVRTVALIAGAAALSVQSKSAIAAAAGGKAWIASVALPAAAPSVLASGSFVGLLQSTWAAALAWLAGGGMVMAGGKMVTVVVVGAALVVGGLYYKGQTRQVGTAKPANTEQSGALGAFENLQAALRNGRYAEVAPAFQDSKEVDPKLIEKDVSDKVIGVFDYLKDAKPTQVVEEGNSVTITLTEPWQHTTCKVHMTKSATGWVVSDINEMHGFGRPMGDTANVPAPPALDTTNMTGEQIVRGLYEAMIAKDPDRAVGFLSLPNKDAALQYRNMLPMILDTTPITEIREVTMNGDTAFVRFGVAQGYPGAGIVKRQDERQSKIRLVPSSNGLKIDTRGSFLGDTPADYR